MGEGGQGEKEEEGEEEAWWRVEGDRLRSMAGGVQQDPGRSWDGQRESGEEGGDGKVVRKRRWRAALMGAQMEAEQLLFPALRWCPLVLPEGNFKSRGSSNDNMASLWISPDSSQKWSKVEGDSPLSLSSVDRYFLLAALFCFPGRSMDTSRLGERVALAYHDRSVDESPVN